MQDLFVFLIDYTICLFRCGSTAVGSPLQRGFEDQHSTIFGFVSIVKDVVIGDSFTKAVLCFT